MAIFDNCVLASDIDGTLVDSGFISPRNLEAINFFCKNGGTFIISTGRSATALGQVFRLMDKSVVGPSVVLNGGMIYDFKKNKGEVHWKDTRVSQRAEGLASEDGKDRCEDDVDLPPESSSLM